MAELSLFLKENCQELPDLLTVYIGEQLSAQIIAGYNPGHLDTGALTTYTTEVMRSLRRLHGVATAPGGTSYFVSKNDDDRLMLQVVGKSTLYLALITRAREPLRTYMPTFKTLLEACRRHFEEDAPLSTSAGTATPRADISPPRNPTPSPFGTLSDAVSDSSAVRNPPKPGPSLE